MVAPHKFIVGKPVLLVDGSNLLIRLLYARQKGSNLLTVPELITAVSEMFLNHVSEITKKNNCSRVVVAFDLGGSARKKSLYSDYKANRNITNVPSTLTADTKMYMQEVYPKLREVVVSLCRVFNLTTIYEFGIEADDVLGIISERYNEVGKDCIILSNDTDFLQLCSMPKVSCIIPYKQACIDMYSFSEYFCETSKKMAGVKFHACEYIFYKSLVGDTSDNIKGIKGVGYKTLHKLKEEFFTEYPDRAELFAKDQLAFIDECAKNTTNHKFEKMIANNLDTIKLNYKLIDITSKYASSNLVNMSFKILREPAPVKPSKQDVIGSYASLLPSKYSLPMLLKTFDNFSSVGIYVQP